MNEKKISFQNIPKIQDAKRTDLHPGRTLGDSRAGTGCRGSQRCKLPAISCHRLPAFCWVTFLVLNCWINIYKHHQFFGVRSFLTHTLMFQHVSTPFCLELIYFLQLCLCFGRLPTRGFHGALHLYSALGISHAPFFVQVADVCSSETSGTRAGIGNKLG